MLNREGYYVTDVERECTSCHQIFKRTSKTVALCHPCNSTRVKTNRTILGGLWTRARNRSKLSGLEFTITKDDIVIPKLCPIFNTPLVVKEGSSGGGDFSPALDRIDNSKGYTKTNIQVISNLANRMKSSASPEQLVLFSRRMLETFDKS